MALDHPFDWHFQPFWTVAIPALVVAYVGATRAGDCRPNRRQWAFFSLGIAALVLAVMWPLGDLAAHWSLMALVVQRLLFMLAIPPLLVAGTPRPIITRLTRPAPVDAILRIAVKPAPAVVIVTIIAVGTLTTGAVSLAATSQAARDVIQLIVLMAGFVLWAPVLSELPGATRLSALGRGGYLIVQSIVPSFLSIVWIFAKRPLYASYDHFGHVVGMSPVLDQQLAGFLAKLSTIAVLWTVAFIIMTRAQVMSGSEEDSEPLMWSDVEREIERAERRDRREGWAGGPPSETPG
jgi:cytochrome c oxidase assembly factor CtaG